MPDLERILADGSLTVDKLFYQLLLEETHERWVRGTERSERSDADDQDRST